MTKLNKCQLVTYHNMEPICEITSSINLALKKSHPAFQNEFSKLISSLQHTADTFQTRMLCAAIDVANLIYKLALTAVQNMETTIENFSYQIAHNNAEFSFDIKYTDTHDNQLIITRSFSLFTNDNSNLVLMSQRAPKISIQWGNCLGENQKKLFNIIFKKIEADIIQERLDNSNRNIVIILPFGITLNIQLMIPMLLKNIGQTENDLKTPEKIVFLYHTLYVCIFNQLKNPAVINIFNCMYSQLHNVIKNIIKEDDVPQVFLNSTPQSQETELFPNIKIRLNLNQDLYFILENVT